MSIITSMSNPLVKRIRRLRQKKYRQKENAYFVEGLRVVLSAIEAGAEIETLVYCSERLTSDRAWQILAEQKKAGVLSVDVSAQVLESISHREHPVGLGAIVKVTWTELDELAIGAEDVNVALVEVSEPGNLGAVLRTIDATGGSGLILVGQTVDPFHPTAVKASMGTLFGLQISRADSLQMLMEWANRNGMSTIATSARGGEDYWDADYRLPALLLLGSEGEGLPAEALAKAEQMVSIPMLGSASSLNLAVAAGLLLYELRRPGRSTATLP